MHPPSGAEYGETWLSCHPVTVTVNRQLLTYLLFRTENTLHSTTHWSIMQRAFAAEL